VLVVALDDRGCVIGESPVALDQPEEARAVVAHPAEHLVVLRRVVEPGFVRVDDRQQPVAVGIALANAAHS